MRIGDILIAANACDAQAIERGLEHAHASGQRLGSALIDLGLVSSDIVAAALGKQHGITPASEANFASIESDTIALLTGARAYQYLALPLGIRRSTQELAVAMCNPEDFQAVAALERATGKALCVATASERRIRQGLLEHYGPATSQPILPEEEPLELELAPLPSLKERPPPSVPALSTAEAPPIDPEPLPKARVANAVTLPKLREFLSTGRGIVIATVGVIALFAVLKVAYDWLSDKDIPVSGVFEADQVDLRMTLPKTGWIYAPSADVEEENGPIAVRAALLYRGKSLAKPDESLALLRVTGPFPPTISDSDFETIIRALNSSGGRQVSFSGFSAHRLDCLRSDRREGRTAECLGSGNFKGINYDVTAFLWFERSSMIFAMFLTQGEHPAFEDEVDDIIQSIHPM